MAVYYAKEVKAVAAGSQSGTNPENIITCIGASVNNRYRAFFQYDLSFIPYKSVIRSAKLRMCCQSHFRSNETALFNVARVTGEWDETSLSYSNLPSSEGTYLAEGETMVEPEIWTDWDITALVQMWVDRTCENYGMQIVYPNEGSSDAEWWVYNRRQAGKATYIEIEYEPSEEYRISRTRMVEIAAEVRRITGSTENLTPAGIVTALATITE